MADDDHHHQFRHSDTASESDSNEDSVSQTSSHIEGNPTAPSQVAKATPQKRKNRKSRQEWEIIEGLRDGQKCEDKPEKFTNYLMKRRKWPMKGWHKRFFVLEKGILTYAKSPYDIQKGKYHGVIDIGLAVLTFKRPGHRIDIDAEEQIYHIKVKDNKMFEEWLSKFRHHRLYRQHEISYGTKESPRLTEITSPTEDLALPPLTTANLPEKTVTLNLKKEVMRQSSFNKGIGGTGQGRVAAWVLDTAGFEQCNKGLSEAQKDLCDLQDLLDQIQNLPVSTDATIEFSELESSEKKKSRRSLGMRSSKKKDRQIGSPTHVKDPNTPGLLNVPADRLHSSASNPNLLNHFGSRPQSLTDNILLCSHEQRIQEIKLRENFISRAQRGRKCILVPQGRLIFNRFETSTVHQQLKTLLRMMSTERERLKQTVENDARSTLTQSTNAIASLKQALTEAHRQNTELRGKLQRIHTDSSLADLPHTPSSPPPSPRLEREMTPNQLGQSLSVDSFSMSEYYDAEEIIETISESSSEQSDEEEISSEVSDEGETDETPVTSVAEEILPSMFPTGRRSKLPVPKPDTGDISLWNLLYKNIGKDLTKISMPVTLNEPLSSLQRLCEELEYSDLLDKAVEYDDPYERMIYVAAFSVSCYASSYYRAGHKPFNPLLGETYECIREDRGWRFIAEQVSHHPPISACFCDSRNFTFWQDVRIKTKFWGKSMEIQPIGIVNVCLPKYGDHYKWNKVTTCVHNLLGGQRWVDQYGEMTITNGGITCKLTFTKASHWSSNKYEIYGSILNADGNVVHNLFGKWNEALFCGHASSARCIWRPGAMPEDYVLYYGFSRFAVELNELDEEQARFLPPTDSRFRRDQRLLEEGRVQEAETEKHRLEQNQRDRRKKDLDAAAQWFSKKDENGKEIYQFNGRYWNMRKEPGFAKMSFIKIW